MIFYKAILEKNLNNEAIIPGTVTTDFDEAMLWYNRYNSKKNNGITRHLEKGKAVIIELYFDETELKSAFEFQRAGVHEHQRMNCWTSIMKTKAQINTPIYKWKVVYK